MRKRGVIIAGGQASMESEVCRIGHLGYVSDSDVVATVAALEGSLGALGMPVDRGAGVAAAEALLA
jgi:aspartate aminotransferase-like enzyme